MSIIGIIFIVYLIWKENSESNKRIKQNPYRQGMSNEERKAWLERDMELTHQQLLKDVSQLR